MKREVPGTSAGSGFHFRRIGRDQPAFLKTIEEELVNSQIGCDREAPVRRRVRRMRMRTSLAFLVYARAGVLYESRRLAESAVFSYRKHGRASASVVGGQKRFRISR